MRQFRKFWGRWGLDEFLLSSSALLLGFMISGAFSTSLHWECVFEEEEAGLSAG